MDLQNNSNNNNDNSENYTSDFDEANDDDDNDVPKKNSRFVSYFFNLFFIRIINH